MPAHIEKCGAKQFAISYPLLNRLALRIFCCSSSALLPRSDNAGRSERIPADALPVFVDLRRKFDKITRRVGAGSVA